MSKPQQKYQHRSFKHCQIHPNQLSSANRFVCLKEGKHFQCRGCFDIHKQNCREPALTCGFTTSVLSQIVQEFHKTNSKSLLVDLKYDWKSINIIQQQLRDLCLLIEEKMYMLVIMRLQNELRDTFNDILLEYAPQEKDIAGAGNGKAVSETMSQTLKNVVKELQQLIDQTVEQPDKEIPQDQLKKVYTEYQNMQTKKSRFDQTINQMKDQAQQQQGQQQLPQTSRAITEIVQATDSKLLILTDQLQTNLINEIKTLQQSLIQDIKILAENFQRQDQNSKKIQQKYKAQGQVIQQEPVEDDLQEIKKNRIVYAPVELRVVCGAKDQQEFQEIERSYDWQIYEQVQKLYRFFGMTYSREDFILHEGYNNDDFCFRKFEKQMVYNNQENQKDEGPIFERWGEVYVEKELLASEKSFDATAFVDFNVRWARERLFMQRRLLLDHNLIHKRRRFDKFPYAHTIVWGPDTTLVLSQILENQLDADYNKYDEALALPFRLVQLRYDESFIHKVKYAYFIVSYKQSYRIFQHTIENNSVCELLLIPNDQPDSQQLIIPQQDQKLLTHFFQQYSQQFHTPFKSQVQESAITFQDQVVKVIIKGEQRFEYRLAIFLDEICALSQIRQGTEIVQENYEVIILKPLLKKMQEQHIRNQKDQEDENNKKAFIFLQKYLIDFDRYIRSQGVFNQMLQHLKIYNQQN